MAGGSFNGGGDGRPQGGGVKKRCNNQIDYNEDNKGRSKESGGRIRGLVGRCHVCHRAAAKKTAAGGGEVPLTTAPELLASATSLEGARPSAIGGGRHRRIVGEKGAGGRTCVGRYGSAN